MKKITLEILRNKNHIHGYSECFPITENQQRVLDFILDWTDKQEKLGNTVTVYKHYVRAIEENISTDNFYIPGFDKNMKIPYCDLVYYLDIYYQEK